jgi:hypothetical protein
LRECAGAGQAAGFCDAGKGENAVHMMFPAMLPSVFSADFFVVLPLASGLHLSTNADTLLPLHVSQALSSSHRN